MPTDTSAFSATSLTTASGKRTASSIAKQIGDLSTFDFEQMCLALVILAERILELKQMQSTGTDQHSVIPEGECDENLSTRP